MSITSKKIVSIALTATTFAWMLGAALLPVANAQTTADLQAQIAALLAQIQQLQAQLNGSTSSASSYQFYNNLTVGSTGADVKALQQLLINKGYLSIAAPTGYFGSLTQAAVAKLQADNNIAPAVGFFGPITRAFVNAEATSTGTGSTSTGTGTTVAPATGLSVGLASDNPVTGSLITSASGAGAARVPVLGVNFTAGNSGAVTITDVKFNKTGVLADSSVAGAYLTLNGQVIAQYTSINQGVIDFSGLSWQIPAGQTEDVQLAIDVAGGLNPGNTTSFSLTSASNVTAWDTNNNAVTPSGNFPINGNTFTVTSVSNPSLASVVIASSSIGTSVNAGTQGNLAGAWTFNVGSNAVWLKGITLHVIGSANMANIQNVKLDVNGVQVGATLASVQNNIAYFNLQSSPATLTTGNNSIQVFADVMGSPNTYFQFEILNSYDVLAVDSQYNVPVTITNNGGAGSQVSISQGQITVTQDANTPTGNIAAGQSQQTLAKFDIYAAGEPVRVKFMGIALSFNGVNTASTTQLSNLIQNVSLTDDAGNQVGSTINTPPSGNSCTSGATGYVTASGYTTSGTGIGNFTTASSSAPVVYVDCFGTSASNINYVVPANTTRVLSLKADVQSTALFSSVSAQLEPESSNLQGMISSAQASSAGASGSLLTLSGSSLMASQNGALGTQNVSAGASGVTIGSYALTASSAQGVNVNTVSIQANGMTGALGSPFQNLRLMINGTQFGNTVGSIGSGTTYVFSGNPFTVPAGSTVNVNVMADTLSSATSTVVPATILTGCSGTGSTSFGSISCSPVPVNGQNLNFGTGSAVTVGADSSQPPSGQIVMGSTGNTLAVYRFTETSNVENVKVNTLIIKDTTTGSSTFSNLQLWNGSTLLGTAGAASSVSGGYAYTFNLGTSIIVPQANSVSITLKGDAASYSSGGATDNSSHAFGIAASSSVTALGATSNKNTTVTVNSASGNPQTVLRTSLAVSTAALGVASNRSKGNPDDFGTITFTANSAGPVALNKVAVTFSGTFSASSTFWTTSTISLIDANGNNVTVSDGATEATSSTSGVTWTFGNASSGFQISAGSSYTFKLRLNTIGTAGISGVSESLSATIQNSTDVQYTDGLDGAAISSIGLPTSTVPLTINSVSYGQGL